MKINRDLNNRERRQIDRTDALLGGFNVVDAAELPLLESTGEKTRKTYDFTSEFSSKQTTKVAKEPFLRNLQRGPLLP